MTISRRLLVRGLGAGVLGTGALSACGEGGLRRRGRARKTTPAPTGAAPSEPDVPLVIGQIGASHGRAAAFEKAISVAIDEAGIDVNARWGGLFGQEVRLLERHVMQEPGEDLAPVVQELAESGATCVITSIDEEALIEAMPAFVEAGLAVIDVFTSAMDVRSSEVQTANLLVRLAPDDTILAARLGEAALGSGSDRAGPAGTVAYLSEDTVQGRSLLRELERYLGPRNGRVVSQQLHPVGDLGDVAARVEEVLEEPPALLVVNGGPETGPFLSALYEETLDEGGRPEIQVPVQLSPAATIDYSRSEMAGDMVPECLGAATGMQPGGAIAIDHENMMLNRSADFLTEGYAYSQQGYDAVVMACLAAQHALSVTGTALAAALPAILTGSEACEDYEQCRRVMRTALETQDRATVAYSGRMGRLELGPRSDARIGELREYSWTAANAFEPPTATGFEAEQ